MGFTNAFCKFVDETYDMVINYPVRNTIENPKYYAVIVEPRSHRYLEYVVKNVLRFTDINWGIHIFHGLDNEEYIKSKLASIKHIKYTNLNVHDLNFNEYAKLSTSVDDYYNKIESDVFLRFEIDSLMLKEGLNDYVMYDYVGSPWPNCFNHLSIGGNGGFSIRNKAAMIKIVNTFDYSYGAAEDCYFSSHLKDFNTPSFDLKQKFGVETVQYHDPIGVHAFIENVTNPNLMSEYKQKFKINK